MKWIFGGGPSETCFKKPEPCEEVLAVFAPTYTMVRHAFIDEDGNWFESGGEEDKPIYGHMICWKPWPKSPFGDSFK